MWRAVFVSIRMARGKSAAGKRRAAAGIQPEVGEHSLALRLEYRIKQLTKRQKERLVAGDGSFETLLESLRGD
jgi:putative endonuclease